jgi:AcrR family transcriptional regulator/DNA-binding MarR family transcriptional regulator
LVAVASRARSAPTRDALDPSGGRGGVAAIQRARMIAALAEVSRERGVAAATVAHIVARSGVSRRTFYELFEDREDCFRAAFELAVEHAAQRVIPAFQAGRDWLERIRGGLGALLGFLEDEPDLGALCVVDALGAGPQALARRAEVLDVLIDAVDEGHAEARREKAPERLTAEGVVGAVLAVLHARLAAGDPKGAKGDSRQPTADLLAPLMGIVVLPYRGRAAAAREAARPAPARRHAVHTGSSDPLRDLDMRLTYRTVRVLLAIAGNSGASNREVADASGVQDQGQISKLLARLEHLGLIHNNSGAGASRGEPNAWRLTGKGKEVERAIRLQTTPGGLDV